MVKERDSFNKNENGIYDDLYVSYIFV